MQPLNISRQLPVKTPRVAEILLDRGLADPLGEGPVRVADPEGLQEIGGPELAGFEVGAGFFRGEEGFVVVGGDGFEERRNGKGRGRGRLLKGGLPSWGGPQLLHGLAEGDPLRVRTSQPMASPPEGWPLFRQAPRQFQRPLSGLTIRDGDFIRVKRASPHVVPALLLELHPGGPDQGHQVHRLLHRLDLIRRKEHLESPPQKPVKGVVSYFEVLICICSPYNSIFAVKGVTGCMLS